MNYNFLNRCNGCCIPVPNFSENAVQAFENVVDDARKCARGLLGDKEEREESYHFGHRFYDNRTVLDRIESAATEEEFMQNPEGWAIDALRDCAGADHWYTFEKEW